MPAWYTTQTLNTNYNPVDRDIQQSHFDNDIGYDAVYGGHYPEPPFRPAIYQQNYSGVQYWQTWNLLDYPLTYRQYVTRGNANDTVALLQYRNQASQYAAAPIAIQQYALGTQQVYVGSDYSYG